jgi:hypothetical protein
MGGYALFARNNNNMCSVASYGSYPIVNAKAIPSVPTAPLTPTCQTPGYYAYSGCQSYFYCSQYTSNSTCSKGNILNESRQYCSNANTTTCTTSSGVCKNGPGWYNYPGCSSIYYCGRSIYNLTAPAGYLYDQSSNTFKSASTFKCPI